MLTLAVWAFRFLGNPYRVDAFANFFTGSRPENAVPKMPTVV
jgi:hypothetical protein